MTANFDRGTLRTSSWHHLETLRDMNSAEEMIAEGRRSGAIPVSLDLQETFTASGLRVPRRAVVASYQEHADRVVGVVGGAYCPTTPEQLDSLIVAACEAGAVPDGIFSLCDGTRTLATFDVGGNGIRTKLMIADSYDGTLKLTVGTTCTRVVCSNTLAVAIGQDGAGMSRLKHTASLEEKIAVLSGAIGAAISTGETVRNAYHAAEEHQLSAASARRAFDLLFPAADEGASKSTKTRAENAREAARAAARLPINAVGGPGTLATLWNAATYLVDRNADGSARETRGGDALDSILFGSRAERVNEVQAVIETVMADGTFQRMTIGEARSHGVDDRQIGRALLADMLDN